ncbi:MAG: hypothetical protein ACK4E8_12515 [Lacibacter sp.]
MKKLFSGCAFLTTLFLIPFKKHVVAADTAYICLNYRSVNAPWFGFEEGTRQRVFFTVNGNRKVYLLQTPHLFDFARLRCVRLIIPEQQNVAAGIQILGKEKFAGPKKPFSQFDTTIVISSSDKKPIYVFFNFLIDTNDALFGFSVFPANHRKVLRRSGNLRKRHIIAEYNYNDSRLVFFKKAGKSFLSD